MELKLKGNNGFGGEGGVLIAPLWNWNDDGVSERSLGVCSNRTFMELKLISEFIV